MSGQIYLEPEELNGVCDDILSALEDAELARVNLVNTYSSSIEGMNSDFIDKLNDSIDICDIIANENSITILTNQVLNIKDSVEFLVETDSSLIGV